MKDKAKYSVGLFLMFLIGLVAGLYEKNALCIFMGIIVATDTVVIAIYSKQ